MDEKKIDKLTELDSFGITLATLAHEQVVAREPIERRWLNDITQYQGKNGTDTIITKKADYVAGNEKESGFTEAFVNATRHKTNAGVSIIGDLLFPNDQKNWGIDPTPVPSIADDAKSTKPVTNSQGQQMMMGNQKPGEKPRPVTEGDVAARAVEIAKERAEKMELAIEDQFVECRYNGESRKAIHFSALIGTGVLKGPIVQHTAVKKWQADPESAEWSNGHSQERTAVAKNVNPFHIYPDMTASTPDEIEFIFEASFPNKRQIRELANDPAVNQDQLRKVLETGPGKSITYTEYQQRLRAISGLNTITEDKRFEMFAYYGPISSEILLEVGVIKKKEAEDILKEYYGVVWFIGNVVIRVKVNPDGFEPFPYYFYAWEIDHASVFGYGVPYLMRQSQATINVAWRQMLDNSSNTAGPQIIIDKGMLEPENGDWEIKPFKIWTKKRSSQASVKDAFSVFSFNNHQQEIAGIFNMAQEIADQESGIPKLQEGQQGKAQTLGEASMQQANANNDTRRRIREWDDEVTTKLIGQFYDWNMRFNKDPAIKGDFKIKATGSSTLLAREQTQNALIQVARDIMPNDQFAPYIKTQKILKKLIQSFHLADEGIIRTEDEVKAIQAENAENKAPDPLMARAEAEMAMVEVKKQEVQLGFEKMKASIEMEYVKLAQTRDLTLEQLDKKLESVKIAQRVNLHKFNKEVELKMVEGEGI